MAREAAAPRVSAMSFEEALEALEEVVTRLEGGDTPLDESIALYERGAALREHCERKLRDAELKVEKIVARADAPPETRPLDESGAEAPGGAAKGKASQTTAAEDDIPF